MCLLPLLLIAGFLSATDASRVNRYDTVASSRAPGQTLYDCAWVTSKTLGFWKRRNMFKKHDVDVVPTERGKPSCSFPQRFPEGNWDWAVFVEAKYTKGAWGYSSVNFPTYAERKRLGGKRVDFKIDNIRFGEATVEKTEKIAKIAVDKMQTKKVCGWRC